MRPFIPAPNVARLQAIFYYNGSVCENVTHWRAPEPFTDASMRALAASYRDWWESKFPLWFSDENQFARIEVQALDEEQSPGIVFTDGLPIIGTSVLGNQLPANVTACITLRTPYRGRSYRGRLYHIGLAPDSVVGNKLTGLNAIFLGTAYTELAQGLGATNVYKLCIVSYRHNNAWRTEAVVTNVNSVYVSEELDSQRRRLTGRGI